MRFRLYEENALNDPDVQDTLEELPEEEADIVEEILNKVNFDPIDNPNDITDALDSALDTAIESLEFGEATSGAAANILLVGGAGTGSANPEKQNVYGFARIGDTEYKQEIKFVSYNAGYVSGTVQGIEYHEGDTITVGVHVESSEADVWGDVDDLMLNIVL